MGDLQLDDKASDLPTPDAGVSAVIVLGAWESRAHGEGPQGTALSILRLNDARTGRCEVFGREVRSRASLLREPVPDEPNAVKAASTVLQNKGTEPIVPYGPVSFS